MWSIVGIYLLCPIRLSSPISIYSLINNVSDTFLEHHSLPLNAKNFADKNKTYNEKNQKTKDSNKSKFDNVSSTNKNQKTKQNQNNTAGTENISQSLTVTTTAYIWFCGCIVLLVRNLFLIWRTKQTVLMAIRRKDNIYESEEDYQESMGIPRCPNCGGMVQGDAPDATYWFNCKSCGERFYLEDGELISPFDSSRQNSSRICSNCGQSLSGGEYTAPWENGNNSEGYVICPHCGYTNFEWDD